MQSSHLSSAFRARPSLSSPGSPCLPLLSATAQRISIEGGSSLGRARQPLPKPASLPAQGLLIGTHRLRKPARSHHQQSSTPSNPSGAGTSLLGWNLVQGLHSIIFMISELERSQKGASLLSSDLEKVDKVVWSGGKEATVIQNSLGLRFE